MDEGEAVKHFEAVRSSSSVLPYVTKVSIVQMAQQATQLLSTQHLDNPAVQCHAAAAMLKHPQCDSRPFAWINVCWQSRQPAYQQLQLLLWYVVSLLPCCWCLQEVGAWKPAAPAALQQLPPVLALGGAADRIIRPFQVSSWAALACPTQLLTCT
jgi:hypothetical protein